MNLIGVEMSDSWFDVTVDRAEKYSRNVCTGKPDALLRNVITVPPSSRGSI